MSQQAAMLKENNLEKQTVFVREFFFDKYLCVYVCRDGEPSQDQLDSLVVAGASGDRLLSLGRQEKNRSVLL